jgi:hypothetical protein
VHFKYRPLLVRSVGMYRCEKTCFGFALELHYDAADVRGVWDPQDDLALYNIEVGVVLVRVLQSDRNVHCVGLPVECFSCDCLLWKRVFEIAVEVERHITLYEGLRYLLFANKSTQRAKSVPV